jgi:hypothetical protein
MDSAARVNANFYFFELNKHLPRWASLDHPVVKRELSVWRHLSPRWETLWNNVWFLFLFLPMFGSVLCGLAVLVGSNLYGARAVVPFLAALWLLQILPSWGIKVFASLGASLCLTREREQANWVLMRITPLSVSHIVGAKIAGLIHWMSEPLIIVLIMRVIAAIATSVMVVSLTQTPAISTSSFGIAFRFQPSVWFGGAALSILIFTFSFIEIASSLMYNCGIGLMASSLARNSTTAIVINFTLQLILWLFIFLPLQRILAPLITELLTTFYQGQVIDVIAPIMVGLMIPIAAEAWLAFTAFRIALRRAQTLIE